MNPVPKPFTTNTGENVESIIEDFFIETRDYIKEFYDKKDFEFEIRSANLSYNDDHITDDRVKYVCCGDLVVASVFITRNDWNYVNYTFARTLGGLDLEDPRPSQDNSSQ